jgi:Xaa-Pro aminopeptidase
MIPLTSRTAQSARTLALATVALLGVPALAGGGTLPLGTSAEPTLLGLGARVLIGALGVALMVAGARLGRLTAGTFFLLLCVGISFAAFSDATLLAVAAIAWALYAIDMALHLFVPRLGAALLGSWPLAVVYLAIPYLQGSFSWRTWVVLVLVLAGTVLGALAPNASLALVAPTLGIVLLWAAWPGEIAAPYLAALFVTAVIWSTIGMRLVLPPRQMWSMNRTELRAQRRREWRETLTWGGAALVVSLLALGLFAPRPRTVSARGQQRLDRVRERVDLTKPALLLSAESSSYLFDRPLPVALVGGRGRFLDRLDLLVRGGRINETVATLRTTKDEGEIEAIRRACAITSQAFVEIAPLIRPGVNESEIQTAIERSFAAHGATGLAFSSIVASGVNAILPHYSANNDDLEHGLVVIDIGATFQGYASDQTRTFPVRGRWTPAERRLLAVVLDAKEAARQAIKPGASYREVNRLAREVVVKAGLERYIGLDVHDPGADTLAAGMVVTIEPGLYIPAGAPIERVFWDLGIRVEDTYLVTETGCEALTSGPEALWLDEPRRP